MLPERDSTKCTYISDNAFLNNTEYENVRKSNVYVFKIVENEFDFMSITFQIVEKFRLPYSCGYSMIFKDSYVIMGCPFMSKNDNGKTIGGIVLYSKQMRNTYHSSKTLHTSKPNNVPYLNLLEQTEKNELRNSNHLIIFGHELKSYSSSHNTDQFFIVDLLTGKLSILSVYTPQLTFINSIKIDSAITDYVNLSHGEIWGIGGSNPYTTSNMLRVKEYVLFWNSNIKAQFYFQYDNRPIDLRDVLYNALLMKACRRNQKFKKIKKYVDIGMGIGVGVDIGKANNVGNTNSLDYKHEDYECVNCEPSDYSNGVQDNICVSCVNTNDFSQAQCNNYCQWKKETKKYADERAIQNNNRKNSNINNSNSNSNSNSNRKNRILQNTNTTNTTNSTLPANPSFKPNLIPETPLIIIDQTNYNSYFGTSCYDCNTFIKSAIFENKSYNISNNLETHFTINSPFCGLLCKDPYQVTLLNKCYERKHYFSKPDLFYLDITDSFSAGKLTSSICTSFSSCFECTFYSVSKCNWCEADKLCMEDIGQCETGKHTVLPANITHYWLNQKQCSQFDSVYNSFCGAELLLDEYLISKNKNFTINSNTESKYSLNQLQNKYTFNLIFPKGSDRSGFFVDNVKYNYFACHWKIKLLNIKTVNMHIKNFKPYQTHNFLIVDLKNNKEITLNRFNQLPFIQFQTSDIEIYFTSNQKRIFENEQVIKIEFEILSISVLTEAMFIVIAVVLSVIVFSGVVCLCCYLHKQKQMSKITTTQRVAALKVEREKRQRINKYIDNDNVQVVEGPAGVPNHTNKKFIIANRPEIIHQNVLKDIIPLNNNNINNNPMHPSNYHNHMNPIASNVINIGDSNKLNNLNNINNLNNPNNLNTLNNNNLDKSLNIPESNMFLNEIRLNKNNKAYMEKELTDKFLKRCKSTKDKSKSFIIYKHFYFLI